MRPIKGVPVGFVLANVRK